ncbi:MAG: HAD-IIIA family hydrolase [Marinisporobacter sp.]|nr:HAD-IIIA family hydrolase [Marinisporobacter sp.]
MREQLKEKFSKIKLFIMDVDGTLTDGKIYLTHEGQEMKAFHVKDGMGIKILQKHGILPVVITGRTSNIVNIRAKELNISEIYQGVRIKLEIYKELKEKYHLKDENIAYIGDDLNDLEIMKQVGVKFAVGDAIEEIKEIADYVTNAKGGEGAVREAIEWMIKNYG